MLRGFNGRERLVPEHDLFAGSLPQALREILESLRVARDADDVELRAELLAEGCDFRDHVAFVAHDGVWSGELAGLGRRDADAFRAEVDRDHHAADSIRVARLLR